MQLETSSLQEFFRKKIDQIQRKRSVSLREETQVYVVHLLSEFIDAERLHSSTSAKSDEPLAITYARALGAAHQADQFRLLKLIGDRSLYVSGFFSDSFNRKIIDVDYYISMGESAYGSASQISRDSFSSRTGLTQIFGELANKFVPLVDVISEISEDAKLTNDSDLLRLYERWLKTKSDRLSEKLKERGIAPVVVGTEPIH